MSVARVSEETAMRLSRHQLEPRTIMLPRRGRGHEVARYHDEQREGCPEMYCIKIELRGEQLVPEFRLLLLWSRYTSCGRWSNMPSDNDTQP